MQLEPWRKILYLVTVSEFIAVSAFGFFAPFIPLYIQQLGHLTQEEAALWSGIAMGGGGIGAFLSAPLWGMLADRWGRKPMLIRAQILGAIIAGLFALAPNIYVFSLLRILAGVLTGIIPAALALVAAVTPRDKIPFAMGILMAAIYSGTTMGPLIGGFLADKFGYHTTFIVTGILLFLGSMIILFFVKEHFQRPTREQQTSLKDLVHLAISPEILSLLIVIIILNIGPQMISPVLPLIISSLSSTVDTATMSGLAFALIGGMSAVSSLVATRIHGKFSLKTILVFCCFATGLLYLPPMWAFSVNRLIILVGLTGIFVGGIFVSSSSIIGMKVPITQQGVAYGLSSSATALGMGMGPLLGGGLASLIGLRSIFGVTTGIFIIAGTMVTLMLAKQTARSRAVNNK